MPTMPAIERFGTDQLETVAACPWCEEARHAPLFVENGYPIVQCAGCSLIYLRVRLKEEFVPLIYDDANYHAASDRAWLKRTGEKRLDLLEPLPAGARLFEDGAGAGGFLAACRSRGYAASGCDLGAGAVRTARDLFDVDLAHGTLASLGLPDAAFDVVASFNLLSHLYAPWDYLAEARRVLADDGVLYLRTGLRDGAMAGVRRGGWSTPEHVFHYTRRAIGQMLARADLELVRMIPAFDSDYPYFLFDYGRGGRSAPRRLARRLCGATALAWTLLGLPKDDAFLIARPLLRREGR